MCYSVHCGHQTSLRICKSNLHMNSAILYNYRIIYQGILEFATFDQVKLHLKF